MKKEFTDGRTDAQTETDQHIHDRHNTMTIARWPLASGAKIEIKHLSPMLKLNTLRGFAREEVEKMKYIDYKRNRNITI